MGSREKLTDAMAELLWERGYAATSPRDILSTAGVGQGSMYHYFSGKHELAVTSLEAMAQDVESQSSLLVTGEGPAIGRMKQYLQQERPGTKGCRVGRMTQDPEVVRDAEMISIIAGTFDVILSRWRLAITEAMAQGDLDPDTQVDDLAHAMVATIQGGYVLARAKGSQEPMDAAIRGAVQLLDQARPSVQG